MPLKPLPVWLTPKLTQLIGLHHENKLPHALLVNGSAGVGKKQLAQRLGHLLMCHQPNGHEPCDACRGCELVSAGSHPDIYLVEPDEQGKQIKVDQIRALSDFVCSTAQQGGYRVVILTPADAMNIAAANALLKMLEEPGNDTLLMLLTDRLGEVMPTIKSRCQRIDCPTPETELASQYLVNAISVTQDEAQRLLEINRGSPFLAETYFNDQLDKKRETLIKGLADVLKGRSDALQLAQSWQKQELELLLSWFYGLVSEAIRAYSLGEESLAKSDAKNMLTAIVRKAPIENVFTLHDTIQACRLSLIQRQNVNKQMLLEQLLLKWAAILKKGV
ncbi:MAG: DNA polymerase III subunit delta' [Pontibacterium sp.]